MKKSIIIFCIIFNAIFSQTLFKNLTAVDNENLIFSDIYNSKIYKFDGKSIDILLDYRGAGEYFEVDKDQKLIAFKIIDENDLQTPVVYDIQKKYLLKLYTPSNIISQVGILENNSYFFAVDDTLIIWLSHTFTKYKLKGYSNQIIHRDNKFYYITKDNIIYCFDVLSQNNKLIVNCSFLSTFFNPIITNEAIYYQSIGNDIYRLDLFKNQLEKFDKGRNLKLVNNNEIMYIQPKFLNDSLISNRVIIYNPLNKTKRELTFDNNLNDLVINNNQIYLISQKNSVYNLVIKNSNTESYISFPLAVSKQKMEKNNNTNKKTPIKVIENVPYVDQNNDTPDWHWGRTSCAPATAMMILGYYNVLPEWPYQVSYPTPHISKWGGYIADKYIFMGNYYTQSKDVYNGSTFKNTCYGAFAYMWTGGSPYSKMANYYRNHGFTANQTDLPNYASLEQEILDGYPTSVCVMLTTSGHLILAKGILKTGTFLFNDPYGNKNLQPNYGYPNRYGENTYYDWPGYNNGYVNLDVEAGTNAGVAWLIKTRFNKYPIADTIVDDLQFNHCGFTIKTNTTQNLKQPWDYMVYWKDLATGGYNGHFWYANTTNNELQVATWKPNLPEDGSYEIFCYIPSSATATDITYKITTANGVVNIPFNQKNNKGKWASLGIYELTKNTANVSLSTNSSIANEYVVFDAVKFSKVSNPTAIKTNENEKSISMNVYPNPFNSATSIIIKGNLYNAIIDIFDICGKLIESKNVSGLNPIINIDMSNRTSGFYIITLRKDNLKISKKILLLK